MISGSYTKEIKFRKVIITVVISTLLLVFSSYAVLMNNNERNVKQTGEVLLNQMRGVLVKNQAAEATLLASLKEEYKN